MKKVEPGEGEGLETIQDNFDVRGRTQSVNLTFVIITRRSQSRNHWSVKFCLFREMKKQEKHFFVAI